MDRLALGVALLALAVAAARTAAAAHRHRIARLAAWSAEAHANLAFGLLLVAGTVALVALPVLLGYHGPGIDTGVGVAAGR